MSDPAAATADESVSAIRPLVARPVSNRGVMVFAIGAALAAIALFSLLEARRSDPDRDPLTARKVAGEGLIVPPAPLAIPSESPSAAVPGPAGLAISPNPPATISSPLASAPARAQRAPRANLTQSAAPGGYYPPQVALPISTNPGPSVVYQAPGPALAAGEPAAPSGASGQRVEASRFLNPATTIPKGTVIQAVLETALDSNRPGPARAIVSRDVRGFDGTKVLIPRGSRLYGEYKADLQSGQNRVMVQWLRLMRPDGVVIDLDSPSADALGRAGVSGKVNSHFWARFSSAFLQTTLNAGMSLATRSVTGNTLIFGLPGSTQALPSSQPDAIRPTLTVMQGAQVSVFVAHDLDFTNVEP